MLKFEKQLLFIIGKLPNIMSSCKGQAKIKQQNAIFFLFKRLRTLYFALIRPYLTVVALDYQYMVF